MRRVLLGWGGRPVSADKWEMGGHRARGGPRGGVGGGSGRAQNLRTLEKPSHPQVTLCSLAGAFEGSEKQEWAWTADSPLGPQVQQESSGRRRQKGMGSGGRLPIPTGEGVEGLQKHLPCTVGRAGLGVQLNRWRVWL